MKTLQIRQNLSTIKQRNKFKTLAQSMCMVISTYSDSKPLDLPHLHFNQSQTIKRISVDLIKRKTPKLYL